RLGVLQLARGAQDAQVVETEGIDLEGLVEIGMALRLGEAFGQEEGHGLVAVAGHQEGAPQAQPALGAEPGLLEQLAPGGGLDLLALVVAGAGRDLPQLPAGHVAELPHQDHPALGVTGHDPDRAWVPHDLAGRLVSPVQADPIAVDLKELAVVNLLARQAFFHNSLPDRGPHWPAWDRPVIMGSIFNDRTHRPRDRTPPVLGLAAP